MKRVLAGVLVIALLAGVALVIAGAGKGGCPMHANAKEDCPHAAADCPKEAEKGCCAVKEGYCPKFDKAAEACCEACPLNASDCPKAGESGCCEACLSAKNTEEVKPAGCPMAAPTGCPMMGSAASDGGCSMHAASGSADAAPGEEQAK